MSAVINQGSHSWRVALNDTIDIPSIQNLKRDGFISGVATNRLLKTGPAGFFITNNVMPLDIVYNFSTGTAATVVSVVSESEIIISADIFTVLGQGFMVFSNSSDGVIEYPILYNTSAAATLRILTSGGDDVILNNVPIGPLPIKVRRLFSTGTTAGIRVLALS